MLRYFDLLGGGKRGEGGGPHTGGGERLVLIVEPRTWSARDDGHGAGRPQVVRDGISLRSKRA